MTAATSIPTAPADLAAEDDALDQHDREFRQRCADVHTASGSGSQMTREDIRNLQTDVQPTLAQLVVEEVGPVAHAIRATEALPIELGLNRPEHGAEQFGAIVHRGTCAHRERRPASARSPDGDSTRSPLRATARTTRRRKCSSPRRSGATASCPGRAHRPSRTTVRRSATPAARAQALPTSTPRSRTQPEPAGSVGSRRDPVRQCADPAMVRASGRIRRVHLGSVLLDGAEPPHR